MERTSLCVPKSHVAASPNPLPFHPGHDRAPTPSRGAKAPSWISVKASGIASVVRERQLRKAPRSMELTELGIVTLAWGGKGVWGGELWGDVHRLKWSEEAFKSEIWIPEEGG